ncbi:SCO-spondin isoform X3 [Microcaecilia unicolor]|nr:SCO-spondin-like isoform X3 [Microcaecilia unicolor]XP_030065592.1 SCO-spondin-like isoform X3 [Microcaecilia unicolor]
MMKTSSAAFLFLVLALPLLLVSGMPTSTTGCIPTDGQGGCRSYGKAEMVQIRDRSLEARGAGAQVASRRNGHGRVGHHDPEENCPPDMYYDSCGTTCPEACDNINLTMICTMMCVPGCFCQDGYVMICTGNDTCVPESECDIEMC